MRSSPLPALRSIVALRATISICSGAAPRPALDAAGRRHRTGGLGGPAHAGLASVYASVFQTWLDDDDPGPPAPWPRSTGGCGAASRTSAWSTTSAARQSFATPCRVRRRRPRAEDTCRAGSTPRAAAPERRVARSRHEQACSARAGDRLRRFPEGRHPRRHHSRGRALSRGQEARDQAQDRFRAAIGIKRSRRS